MTLVILLLPDVSVITFQNLMLYLYRPMIYAGYAWFLQVQLFISIEYYIMRYLILFEKDKSLEEITFEYQNTMKYRRDERKLKRNIIICLLVINFIWCAGWLSNSVYDSVYSYYYPCN